MLEQRVEQADDQEGGEQLGIETRSAMPPETMAGVAAAKVSRKKKRVSS